MNRLNDTTVRERVFDYLSGEISQIDAVEIEDHLAIHPDTLFYYQRWREMLTAASSQSDETWDEPRASHIFENVLEGLEPGGDERSFIRRISWRIGMAAAAAAAVLLAILLFDALRPSDEHRYPSVVTTEVPQPDEPETQTNPLASLKRHQIDGLLAPIFVTPGAQFEITDTEIVELHVSSGTALIEYLPVGDSRPFVVRTPHVEVNVVGTVFYVTVEPYSPGEHSS